MATECKFTLKGSQLIPVVVSLLLMSVQPLPAQTDQNMLVWGAPANGLEISISPDPATLPSPSTPVITLHLRNVGANNLQVLLGQGCGGDEVPNEVILNIKDPSGNIKRLIPREALNICAGIGWQLVVLVDRGKVYSTPLKLDHYVAFTGKGLESWWEPGRTYTLQAVVGLDKCSNVLCAGLWVGTVTSNDLEIHSPAP